MKKLAVHSVHAVAAAAASMFAVPAVLAQDAPAAKSALSGLEEVIVTARRREENLQDVPIAVTAFSAELIENAARRTSPGCSSRRRTSRCRSRAAPTRR